MKTLPVVRPSAPESTPIYPRVAIVGVGLIGASIASAVRRRWPSSLVIGVDRKDIIERAMVVHIIDVGADDLGMVSDADLVVLAAPITVNEQLLEHELPPLISRQATITDVGSTKRTMGAAARNLPGNLMFVGGHPIAGAAAGGLEHARDDLFEGRPWILCPASNQDVAQLRAFVTALGATCVEMSPEEHDRTVAFLSHLPQLAASALMHVVGEGAGEGSLVLAGRGLKDTTRLAGSPPGVWKDVCATNADNLRVALDELIRVLQEQRDDLTRGEALERIFRSARRWKDQLDSPAPAPNSNP
jgi:prephenate dehydrogenase